MDIIPGKTTQEEAYSKINMMADLVDKDSIFTGTYASRPVIGWEFLDSELYGRIHIENEIVSSISIGDFERPKLIRAMIFMVAVVLMMSVVLQRLRAKNLAANSPEVVAIEQR